jgi:hypothetical protein
LITPPEKIHIKSAGTKDLDGISVCKLLILRDLNAKYAETKNLATLERQRGRHNLRDSPSLNSGYCRRKFHAVIIGIGQT